ncbi:AEC family transporter [Shimia sp. SDUM112013]|uniref:AEC family transporter n=1 Tax=Shimia sp. SDUM112013 TaxID=3136160 RepID=UPI0032EF180D
MNLALTVLEITAPVFLLAGVGFTWVKVGFEYRIQFVTQLAMTLAVPCLIFTALMKTEADIVALGQLAIAGTLSYAAVGVVGWALLALIGLNLRTYLAPFIFGNTGNLGIPLALFAFGQAGLERAVVLLAVSAVLSFTIGIWLVAGRGAFGKILKEPMIGATLLGALFLWQGWETPSFLTNTLDLIGQMAIPLMLITLGVAVARLTPGRVVTAIGLSFAKLVICAVIAWGMASWFALEDVSFGVLVLQISTPVAVTAYLLAEKYGADSESVAGFVVVSTLISIAGLPLLLALLL